jgi:hypothetical protein
MEDTAIDLYKLDIKGNNPLRPQSSIWIYVVVEYGSTTTSERSRDELFRIRGRRKSNMGGS